MKIILASGSPRRTQLFNELGIEFEVITSDIDESVDDGKSPAACALSLALRKANGVADRLPNTPTLVIAADTIVTIDGKILGKPADRAEAQAMLNSLRDRSHKVITGVAVVQTQPRNAHVNQCTTDVHFRPFSHDELESYLDTPEPYDKAGAYGIQGKAGQFVDRIDGDYFNVVGLPVDLLLNLVELYMDVGPWRKRTGSLIRKF